MSKYSEEEIMEIVKRVMVALEQENKEAADEGKEELPTAGYAETIGLGSGYMTVDSEWEKKILENGLYESLEIMSKTYENFNNNLYISIGDKILNNKISIGAAKNIVKTLEEFVNDCEPDFYIEKLGEYSPEDMARYTINWFKLIHSVVKLRDALNVSIAINEAPTADFEEKYNEKGHLRLVSDRLRKLQDMYNENLATYREGRLSCQEEEMQAYHNMVEKAISDFSQQMVRQYDQAHRAYLISETKECIDVNKLLLYVDPDVIKEKKGSPAIEFVNCDNETILYSLYE